VSDRGIGRESRVDMDLDDLRDGAYPVATCSLRRVAGRWLFADQERAAIQAHWTRRVHENPGFFNGTVHVMTAARLAGGHFEGTLVETDFASSLYWRETGHRDRTVVDCFGSAILVSTDGALIYGRQAPGHVNAGLAYPPGGFIDGGDVEAGGRVDLDGSIGRELGEETGLDPATLVREPGYLAIRDGALLSIGVLYRSHAPAAQLIDSVNRHLAQQADRELAELVALRQVADISAHPMPSYARRLAQALLPRLSPLTRNGGSGVDAK
jgi:hypothetical protein